MLEISAGTGRNLRYYSKAATSITMTDTSKNMLWHARQKREKYHADVPVTFYLSDAQRMLSNDDVSSQENTSKVQHPTSTYQDKLQTFSPAQFDTVIDTFGLCSHADPVAALKVGWLVCAHVLGCSGPLTHATVHATSSPVL